MRHQISTSININASKETIWSVLTDFNAYPKWNPFIKSITGAPVLNEKFSATIGSMKFRPTLKVFNLNREFTWLGRLLLPGIFDGRHSFLLEENEDGSTTFIHLERFSGLLVPFMKKKLDTEVADGFEAMNRRLKERAESCIS